jgi:uncharacterized protein (TIGR02147 family)
LNNIYTYTDYIKILEHFLTTSTAENPHKALAKELGVHMSKLSKVLSGTQHLTLDQAFLVSHYFNFDSKETEFFMTLVQIARAVNGKFKTHLQKKLRAFQNNGAVVMNQRETVFSRSEEALLHSSPYFLAVWHLSMIDGQNSVTHIAHRLKIDVGLVSQVTACLVKLGLVENMNNRIVPTVRRIDVSSTSSQIDKFLSNWRFVGIEKLNGSEKGNFFYSEPMTLGKNAYAMLRRRMEVAIAECKTIMETERSEVAICLNIDLFEFGRSDS